MKAEFMLDKPESTAVVIVEGRFKKLKSRPYRGYVEFHPSITLRQVADAGGGFGSAAWKVTVIRADKIVLSLGSPWLDDYGDQWNFELQADYHVTAALRD